MHFISGWFNPDQNISVCWTELKDFVLSQFSVHLHLPVVLQCFMPHSVLKARVWGWTSSLLTHHSFSFDPTVWCILGVMWLWMHHGRCSPVDKGKWKHEAPKIQLPWGIIAAFQTLNICFWSKTFVFWCFGFSMKNLIFHRKQRLSEKKWMENIWLILIWTLTVLLYTNSSILCPKNFPSPVPGGMSVALCRNVLG